MNPKTILVTGQNLDLDYNRNLVILNGLKKLGFQIEPFSFSKFNKSAAKKIQELSKRAYFTYIPSFGHKSVSFVKKHSACDVVFDPLISKYMTNVKDYNSYGSFSYEAFRSRYRDQTSISKADFVIFDTSAHREYFFQKYKLPKEKTGVVHIGADMSGFDRNKQPMLTTRSKFRVGFVGHFIPLQGVLTILEAAYLMKDDSNTEFIFVGDGFEFEKAMTFAEKRQLTNVQFTGKVAYQELDSYLNSFDLCMGIFGNTLKSTLVIPNKIFNYASCAKPVLTMDSNAVKEVFTHNQNIYLCEARAEEMALAIKFIKGNSELRNKLGDNIHKLVARSYNEEKIAASLISQYEEFKQTNNTI